MRFFFFFDNIATLNFNLYQFERNSVYKKLLFLGILLNPYAIFADEQKLKGLVILGGGVRIIESHLFPQPKDYLGSRQDKPNVYYQPIPLIGLDVTYNSVTKAKDSIFLKGFSGRNLGGLKLGYAITYGNHKSEFAIISSIYERAYANPYIEGNRKEKALNKYGFNFTQTYMFSPHHNFLLIISFNITIIRVRAYLTHLLGAINLSTREKLAINLCFLRLWDIMIMARQREKQKAIVLMAVKRALQYL